MKFESLRTCPTVRSVPPPGIHLALIQRRHLEAAGDRLSGRQISVSCEPPVSAVTLHRPSCQVPAWKQCQHLWRLAPNKDPPTFMMVNEPSRPFTPLRRHARDGKSPSADVRAASGPPIWWRRSLAVLPVVGDNSRRSAVPLSVLPLWLVCRTVFSAPL